MFATPFALPSYPVLTATNAPLPAPAAYQRRPLGDGRATSPRAAAASDAGAAAAPAPHPPLSEMPDLMEPASPSAQAAPRRSSLEILFAASHQGVGLRRPGG